MKKLLAAATLAATLIVGSAASAAVVVWNPSSVTPAGALLITPVDIGVGEFVNVTEILTPGDTARFVFTALEALRIDGISVAATGEINELQQTLFGFTFPASIQFTNFFGTATSASAVGTLPGFSMAAGDMFTIFWRDGIVTPVGVSTFFQTTPIPVPAALPLLAGGIAALGLLRRRQSRKVAI